MGIWNYYYGILSNDCIVMSRRSIDKNFGFHSKWTDAWAKKWELRAVGGWRSCTHYLTTMSAYMLPAVVMGGERVLLENRLPF